MAQFDGPPRRAACDGYRDWAREHLNFVTYFRQATQNPSSPAYRWLTTSETPTKGGIETLRAIPWILHGAKIVLCYPHG